MSDSGNFYNSRNMTDAEPPSTYQRGTQLKEAPKGMCQEPGCPEPAHYYGNGYCGLHKAIREKRK